MSLHPVLAAAVQEALPSSRPGICLPSGRRDEDERAVMLESLASLWARGYPVDWARRFPGGGRVVPLPGLSVAARAILVRDESDTVRDLERGPSIPRDPRHAGECRRRQRRALGRRRRGGRSSVPGRGPSRDAVGHGSASRRPERRHAGRVPKPSPSRTCAFRASSGSETTWQGCSSSCSRTWRGRRFSCSVARPPEAAWATIASVARLSGPSRDGADRGRHDVDAIQARSDALDIEAIGGWSRHDHRPSLAALRAGDGEALGRLHDGPAAELRDPSRGARGGPSRAGHRAGRRRTRAWRAGSSPPFVRVRAHARLADAAWVYAAAADAVTHAPGRRLLPRCDRRCGPGAARRGDRPAEARSPRGSLPSGRMAATAARRPVRRVRAARWLIVADPATLRPELVARLQAAGDTCVVVSAAQVLGWRRRRRPRVRAPRHGMRSPGERRRRSGRVADRARRRRPRLGQRRWPSSTLWRQRPTARRRASGW